MSDKDYSKMKVAELRDLLKLRGLNSVGNKQELVDRLSQATVSESSGELDKFEDDLLNDDELDEEKSLLDSTHDLLKSPSESVKSTSPESNPAPPPKKVSLKRNISVTVPIIEIPAEEKKSETSEDEPDKKVVKISTMTELDRLEMRAKKFAGAAGSTAAVVSTPITSEGAKEKLQARAARFGIVAPEEKTAAATVTSSVSLDVLKKRAERFGTVLVPELKNSEIQEKIQKRQERFGVVDKTPITAPKATVAAGQKPEYAEKALKRLERFKQAA